MKTTFTRVAGHCCEVTSFDTPAPTEDETRLARMLRDGSIEYVRGADTNADGIVIGGWRARVRAVPLPLADDSEFMCEPYYGFFNVYVTRVNGTSHLFAIDTRGVTPEIDDGRGNTEKYFGGNMLQDLVPDRNPARDICRPKDVLVGECFGAADFLLNQQFQLPAGLGFGLAVVGRMHYIEDGDNSVLDDLIQHVLHENARSECLNFLCARFDEDHVVDTIDAYLQVNNDPDGRDYYWTDAYWDDVVRWYQAIGRARDLRRGLQWNEENGYVRSTNQPGKEHLMNAMATLDTVKERLPEGEYLKIVSDLQKVYETM